MTNQIFEQLLYTINQQYRKVRDEEVRKEKPYIRRLQREIDKTKIAVAEYLIRTSETTDTIQIHEVRSSLDLIKTYERSQNTVYDKLESDIETATLKKLRQFGIELKRIEPELEFDDKEVVEIWCCQNCGIEINEAQRLCNVCKSDLVDKF